MKRLFTMFFGPIRLWKIVLTVGVVLAAIVGGNGGKLPWLFHGDQTKQLFFGCALFSLACAMRKVAQDGIVALTNLWVWGAYWLAGALVTSGGVWNVPAFLAGNPLAAAFLAGVVLLGPTLVGLMHIANRPPQQTSG